MRDHTARMILSVVALGLSAACGGDDNSTGSAGTGGSSNPTSTTGTGGASAGGSGGAGATSGGTAGATSGGSSGAGGVTGAGGTTGTGGAAGTGGKGGASGAGGSSGKGGSAGTGGAGGITDAGTLTDARGTDITDARVATDTSVTDSGARPDVSSPDVITGDAGPSPYKGVANSPCADMTKLGATWFYNWGLSQSGCTQQFIPMLWGHTGNEQTTTGIANAMNTLVSQGFTTVLGFNEPDNTGQSNMTVATAISLWPSFNKPGLRIGSPATSANAAGQMWFNDFMTQVNADTTGTLRVDFIAAHWYGWNAGSCEPNASSLESYIKSIEMIPGNRPIWLTEWGCMHDSNPDEPTVIAFFKGAVAMFAKHPRIERYAWYPWDPFNELTADGGLTGMGKAFADAPQYK